MNVVFQNEPLPPAERFDMVIGTDTFLYYNELEQALARANLATMIKPGGFLFSNTALAGKGITKLEDSTDTLLPITTVPLVTDRMFSYVREK